MLTILDVGFGSVEAQNLKQADAQERKSAPPTLRVFQDNLCCASEKIKMFANQANSQDSIAVFALISARTGPCHAAPRVCVTAQFDPVWVHLQERVMPFLEPRSCQDVMNTCTTIARLFALLS